LFVMAENIESSNCNSTSNYTTHPLCHSEGEDPIKYTNIDLLGKPWISNGEGFFFNGPHAGRNFESIPFETGYRIIPISERPFSHDVGTTFAMKRLEGTITNVLEESAEENEEIDGEAGDPVDFYSRTSTTTGGTPGGTSGSSSGKSKSGYKIIVVGVLLKIYKFDSDGSIYLVNTEDLKKKTFKLNGGTNLEQFSGSGKEG
jgi:hypothetical protein